LRLFPLWWAQPVNTLIHLQKNQILYMPMRTKLFALVVPILLIGVLGFSVLQEEPEWKNDKEVVLNEIIFKVIMDQAHFNHLEIDDELSDKAFDMYLKKLDGTKRFLTRADVAELEKYRYKIDDEVRGDVPTQLLDEATNIWEKRREQAKAYCKEILSTPFDFDKKERFELDAEKRDFAAGTQELKEEWRKYLKYRALIQYHTKLEERKAKAEKDEHFEAKSDGELEEAVRKEIMRNHDNLFDRLEKMDEEDYLADYINAILAVYGPHTEYFPPQEKENFDISMSGRLQGIGAQLSQVDGNIKVVNIVPGSASWKQGELREEDIILEVGQADDEPVSVVGLALKDAVSLIRGKKGTEVRLTVKKPDGRIKIIPIIRDVVILEESYAKSAVIEDKKNNTKTGYIFLPSFYADFNNTGGRNSAEDVRAEIEKLKAKGVSAIVLDLRFNGGGSLQDAVDMSGLFIEKGPVVQVKGKRGNPIILEDKDPSVVWDGPLAIVVNEFSASASEILAAAMQDYDRAVIIGSKATFGKGTVQRFVDLDYYLPQQFNYLKPLGSVKLTIQKFYRITGKSTQWEGVKSDIVIPDVYSAMDVGEKELDFALPWDEIRAKSFEKWEEKPKVSKLLEASNKRINNSPIFEKIGQNAARMKEQRENTIHTLNLEDFMKEQKLLDEESEAFNNLDTKQEHLVINPIDVITPETRLDSIRVEGLEKWRNELQENVYVSEALNVISDMLNQSSVAATPKKN